MYKNVELRKLPIGSLVTVASILDTNNDWKKVMALIPRNPRSDHFEPKYNLEHIKQIEDHARASNRKCTDILFEEWGTSGRIRPTLNTLKEVVQKAQIYRAADEIALMLEEDLPMRPQDGPGARIDTNITLLLSDNHNKMNDTTAQIKSATDGQNEKSLGNKTTAQMKPTTNLIEFSKTGNNSMNVPDLDVLVVSTDNNVQSENVSQLDSYQKSLPNIDFSNSGIATEILTDQSLIHFEYRDLEMITKWFSERLIYTPVQGASQGTLAGKIGSGGFGDVYVGYHPRHGHLAIKRASNQLKFSRKPELAMRCFNAEVKFLSQFRHRNIVPILGYSRDGPCLCIVCEYIDGGSLEQKLAAKILTEKQRLNILIGTAEGLKYLHNSEKPQVEDVGDKDYKYKVTESDQGSGSGNRKNNFVHGDVKTANILLTRDCLPKLCDFGLAKQYDDTMVTSAPMGTSAYMAPEGFTGTITQKVDIYSFGIVLLEILTGHGPLIYLNNGEKINIKDYVEESLMNTNNEITTLLDPFIDKWTKARELYGLAKTCIKKFRKERPTSEEIVEKLYEISGFEKDSIASQM